MAASLALKRGAATANAGSLFNKLHSPFRPVSATPCVGRCINTEAGSSDVTPYEDDKRSVDVSRRPGSAVSRRRDQDFFPELFDPFAPTRSLGQIFNMMDRLMDDPLMSSAGGGVLGRRGWDVKEDNESLWLRFDMPGVEKENVKISVEQDTLIIRGEAEKESEEEEPRRYLSKIVLLPNVYKVDEIKAELKNGVLKIRVPKVKEEERKDVRQIPVE